MNGLELLGTTLLHFLWQGFLIAVFYAAARRCATRPAVRYLLACAALVVMAAAPVATWIALQPASLQTGTVTAQFLDGYGTTAAASFRGELIRFFVPGYEKVPLSWLPWVAAAWMAGVVAFCLRLLVGCLIAERFRLRQVRPAPHLWRQAFDRLRARVGVSQPVRLLVSGLAQVPSVVGLLRPVVLVPAGALTGLPAEQIEALLLHELAHIRRYDHLANAVQSLVEALLFYHPAIWWVSGHMRSERELCCDDVAVAITGDAQSYARALVEVAAAAHSQYNLSVAVTGGSLANRVARLLGERRPVSRTHSPAVIAAAAFVAITSMVLLGQTTRPEFEVASIKPVEVSADPMMRPLPGRLTANGSLRVLMQGAYQLQPFQIVGGPEWIRSEQYEVDAKAAGRPGEAQTLLMLQSLLEDRFKLRIHRESREMPVYALTAARSGLNLPPPQDASCVDDRELLGPLADPATRLQPPGQGVAPASKCGSLSVMLEPGGARLRGGKVPVAEFARVLSRVLGRMLIDRTGFAGVFDVNLVFLPDDTTAGLPPPPPGAALTGTARPPLFSAVQPLGLRLESTRGPVEVIVIDQVERPSAN